jgi:hypothetical protein
MGKEMLRGGGTVRRSMAATRMAVGNNCRFPPVWDADPNLNLTENFERFIELTGSLRPASPAAVSATPVRWCCALLSKGKRIAPRGSRSEARMGGQEGLIPRPGVCFQSLLGFVSQWRYFAVGDAPRGPGERVRMRMLETSSLGLSSLSMRRVRCDRRDREREMPGIPGDMRGDRA